MATLEALDELYSMGFLIEEEYLARRAALGAGPPSAGKTETTSPVVETDNAYDSYTPQTYVPTSEPTYTDTYSYEQPYTPYEPPTAYEPEPEMNLVVTVEDAPFVPPTMQANPTITPEVPAEAPSTAPIRGPVQPEEPFPTIQIQKEIESLANLRITPADDSAHANAFNPSSLKATVVHRTTGRYLVMQVDAPTSSFTVSTQLGLSGDFIPAGSATVQTTKEMYWNSSTWVSGEPVSELEAGKVYLFKERKESTATGYSHIDERVYMRYAHSLLEKTYMSDGVPDVYEGDRRIRDVRTFDGNTWSAYDPRVVLEFLRSLVKKTEYPTGSGYSARVTKLKTTPTPPHMLWPSLIAALRALECNVPEEVTRHLPKTSSEIWAKITQSSENRTCYFSGEPAAHGSFLSARYHKDELVRLVSAIRQYGLYPGEIEKASNSAVTEGVGSGKEPAPEWEERIRYEPGEAPRSYGWPTSEDASDTPARAPRSLGIKPVSRKRQSDMKSLMQQLVPLNGPPAGAKTTA